jgi:hypothetical protein
MFATYLLLDPVEEHLPGMSQVLRALSKLDGDQFSILVVAEASPGPRSEVPFAGKALAVAGGKDDQYVCDAFVDGDYSPRRLVNPAVTTDGEDLIPIKRGQVEFFFKRNVVGREAVAEALEVFAQDGGLSERLCWEQSDLS